MRLGALAVGAVTALIGSSSAFGGTFYVYQGSDFGYIVSDHSYVGVCDREVDGFNVYSEYRRLNGVTGRVEETGGYCRTGGSSSSSVYQLNVCENIPFAPDACSGWKTHY
ncbi:hypothetical protein [Streptomyces vilmorinianum]|uniref:hypothetical protein n=1 Tax=Streptomyces vilmorinianum TaxID=3051092 RepID=UPI0010FB4C0B|nr:hypothetical protein [Streptomyces vilmorinianum]